MTSQPAEKSRVGEYALLTRLGEGGMGIVHLARAKDGSRVALKVLRPQVVGDQEARARLAREVASLERVRSPWIAEVIDADPWADVPYVVTRYVPGLSLYDHVAEEGPIVGRDLDWLAGGLAEGIAAVHRAGVLHRDIKPSNVLMEGRTPILIDFGLARVADDPRLTHTGYLLGTPGYLPPEVLYGDEPTPAADVFAWAATVAYGATGRAPYGKGPAMAVLDRSRRGQHDLSGIAEPMRGVLDAALAPEPLDRPLLSEVLAWLRPRSTDPTAPAVPPPGPGLPAGDPTRPYANPAEPIGLITPPVVTPRDEPVTAKLPTEAEPARGPAITRIEQEWDEQHGLAETPRASFAERTRRATAAGLLALALGGGVAASPWPVLLALLVLVWLLRSGSLAASVVAQRRTARGRKWYDAPHLVVTSPWHVVRAIPGTLGLAAWAVGIGVAVGLIAYAVRGLPTALLLGGTAAGVGLWTGPGGDRFRGPLRRVLHPLVRKPVSWLIVSAVLLAVAAGLAAVAYGAGISWTPWSSGPFGLSE